MAEKKQERDEILSKISQMTKLLEEMEVSLKIAREYSKWDGVRDNLFTDLEKNRTLDEVQEMVAQLDVLANEVRRTRKEFQLDTNIQVMSDETLRIEDYVFDDWSSALQIKDKVDEALEKIRENKVRVNALAKELTSCN